MPIFKNFVENALYKEDFKDFQIPEKIYLTSLNYDTGAKSTSEDKNSIVELIQSDLNSQNIVKNLNNILDSNFRINILEDYEDLRKKLNTGKTVSLEIAKEILDARIA